MTDNTRTEALLPSRETLMAQAQVFASAWAIYSGDGMEVAEQEKAILADMARRLHARIAELEAQLEAIGAGGVSGPLYLAAPPTAQAEWWRLVPVEPTQKMLFVAMNAFAAASASLGAFNAPDAAYRALLAAAPTHPTSAEGVEHG